MASWHTVARQGSIAEGEGTAVAVNGRTIALFNDHGVYRAIDDMCPHAGAPLSQGSVTDGTVICAWHGWRFHLCDGSWADHRKLKINVYPVRIVGEDIQIEVPALDEPAS